MPLLKTVPNHVFAFLAAECTANLDATQWMHVVYSGYASWCKANGITAISANTFGVVIRRLGFDVRRSTDGYMRIAGLCLKNGDEAKRDKRGKINAVIGIHQPCQVCGCRVLYRYQGGLLCSSCYEPGDKQVEYVITEVIGDGKQQ